MPLEIKELTVRINIQQNPFQQKNKFEMQGDIDNNTLKRIIQECTEKVLEIIERNKER